jgi:putative transposase
VLNRGIEKRAIFRGPSGYEHFGGLIARLPQRFGVRVHGYVLMPNHYHLQIETPRANLSRAIQWLNVGYSIWFNRKYKRVGPLFQGRFKAILHDPASHGLTINKYIHLNPVRVRHEGRGRSGGAEASHFAAERLERLRTYPWSSYRHYSGQEKRPEWLTTEQVLGLMGQRASAKRYRRELEAAAGLGELETDWKEELSATLLLGSDEFVGRMKKLLKGNRREQTGLRKAGGETVSWKAISATISEVWSQDWAKLEAGHGNGALGAALYLARKHSDQTLRELGGLAGGMQYPAVTMAIRRLAKRLETDKALAKKVNRVERILFVKT